ncbi:hypothetical protein PHYBLDRAFT_163423 [Phycomyces blakesleeanus NRRL 1555(-)]|uniref:Uncharacterized protein n=1 Tax=Phycomyces blakesleeanus (strain ATCC 8743b / DSM 1359 / FGSC 10004 / NBRC 33097 / NRRL 1555) TaxID=763407 RepID=A0A167PPI9_PHYB8|nr:hypothetical protein PHYBLDRAFT_163423 [Phycomyces blakesleeanus NRRL 1555(-)]OAD78307.1 hypothetical protein PHYBLDRAFT_163423 [Phycomyces blakesleeanus NRRL 1555(-)]|eukprot:XP_018296347.1 hypothetical protein PHYBLDRAFT_163423 [Phycomyces blakesleeanus NRRL 1555(-)]
MRQSKHQCGPQERLMLQMRTREKKGFSETLKVTVKIQSQIKIDKAHFYQSPKSGLYLQVSRPSRFPRRGPMQSSKSKFQKKNQKPKTKSEAYTKSCKKNRHILSPPLQKDQKKSELEAYTKSSTPKGSNPKTEA